MPEEKKVELLDVAEKVTQLEQRLSYCETAREDSVRRVLELEAELRVARDAKAVAEDKAYKRGEVITAERESRAERERNERRRFEELKAENIQLRSKGEPSTYAQDLFGEQLRRISLAVGRKPGDGHGNCADAVEAKIRRYDNKIEMLERQIRGAVELLDPDCSEMASYLDGDRLLGELIEARTSDKVAQIQRLLDQERAEGNKLSAINLDRRWAISTLRKTLFATEKELAAATTKIAELEGAKAQALADLESMRELHKSACEGRNTFAEKVEALEREQATLKARIADYERPGYLSKLSYQRGWDEHYAAVQKIDAEHGRREEEGHAEFMARLLAETMEQSRIQREGAVDYAKQRAEQIRNLEKKVKKLAGKLAVAEEKLEADAELHAKLQKQSHERAESYRSETSRSLTEERERTLSLWSHVTAAVPPDLQQEHMHCDEVVSAISKLAAERDELKAERAKAWPQDGDRVCDQPACSAAIIRRDSGARVCAKGHKARWVTIDSQEDVLARVEKAEARVAELERERDVARQWVSSMNTERNHHLDAVREMAEQMHIEREGVYWVKPVTVAAVALVRELEGKLKEAERERKRLYDLCGDWELAADGATPNEHTPAALKRRIAQMNEMNEGAVDLMKQLAESEAARKASEEKAAGLMLWVKANKATPIDSDWYRGYESAIDHVAAVLVGDAEVPRFTPERVRELLKRSAPGANELKRRCDKAFNADAGRNLVLGSPAGAAQAVTAPADLTARLADAEKRLHWIRSWAERNVYSESTGPEVDIWRNAGKAALVWLGDSFKPDGTHVRVAYPPVPECCATQAGEYPNADQVVVPEEAAIAMVECLDDAAEQGDNACERMAYALQQFVAQGYGRLLRAEVIVYPVKDRGAKPIIATERLLADVFRAGVTWVREKAHLITDPSLSPHMWWPTTTDMQRAAGKLAEEIVTKKAVTFIQDQLPVDEQGSTILPAVKEETPEQEREQEYVRIHALSQRTGNYDPYAVREWSMVQLLHLMDEAAALKEG